MAESMHVRLGDAQLSAPERKRGGHVTSLAMFVPPYSDWPERYWLYVSPLETHRASIDAPAHVEVAHEHALARAGTVRSRRWRRSFDRVLIREACPGLTRLRWWHMKELSLVLI
jgi:hypothetical protein